MKKNQQITPTVKEVGFDDVIRYIGDCTDANILRKISKVTDGRAIYVVNLIPDTYEF
jgi:hypothetical protein